MKYNVILNYPLKLTLGVEHRRNKGYIMTTKALLIVISSVFISFSIQLALNHYLVFGDEFLLRFSYVFLFVYMLISNFMFCMIFKMSVRLKPSKLFSPSYSKESGRRTYFLFILSFILYTNGTIEYFVVPALMLSVSELYYYFRDLKSS